VRLTQKKIIIIDFFFEMIFNDFVEYDRWFDDAWHVMIFFLNLYDDAYMDAWMHEWNLLFSFSFILIW